MKFSLPSRAHRLALVAGLLPTVLLAQDGGGSDADADAPAPAAALQLAPVEVTAEKHPQDAQSVPQSLTVVTGSDLDAAGIHTVGDAARLVPNLHVLDFATRRLSFPFYRGVGSGQGGPAVTTYIDGVPQLSVNTASLTLADVERIEFLPGPQGALYGRNTLGGAINIITRAPRQEWGGQASVGFGSDDAVDLRLNAGGPLYRGDGGGDSAIGVETDNGLFLSLAGGFDSRDGYTYNTVTKRHKDDRETAYGRIALTWQPDADFEARLSLHGERNRDGGFVLSELNALRKRPHELSQNVDGYADRDVISPTLALTWHAGAVDVTSITGYTHWEADEFSDGDFSAFDLFQRYTAERADEFSQELRVASAEDAPLALTEDLALRWMAGVNFQSSAFDSRSYTEARPLAVVFGQSPVAGQFWTDGGIDTWSTGVYGEATLTYLEDIDLILGLRYDYEETDATIHNFAVPAFPGTDTTTHHSADFEAWLPRIALAWRATDHLMPYASVSRGYRAGGFNLNAPSGKTAYDPESAWTYEIGVKSEWLDKRLMLNASLFYVDWDDMQLYLYDAGTGRFYLDNAGRAHSYGGELALRAKVAEHTEVFGSIGLTQAEFDSFTDPISGDAEGNSLAFAPEFTWNLGVEQRLPLDSRTELYGRIDLTGVGRYYYDAGNTQAQGSYMLANARVGVRRGPVFAELWARNAFDQDYIPVAFQLTANSFVAESGDPRTVGVQVGFDW